MSEQLPDSRPESIVIVDDQPVVLEFCRNVLERAGYTVFAASGAAQALSFFEPNRSPVDLALVDIVMPGMSGLELIDHLSELNQGTRIILMSGYAPDEVKKVVGPDAAQYRCMWKPFEANTLVQMIKNALDTPPPDIDVATELVAHVGV